MHMVIRFNICNSFRIYTINDNRNINNVVFNMCNDIRIRNWNIRGSIMNKHVHVLILDINTRIHILQINKNTSICVHARIHIGIHGLISIRFNA